MIEFKSNCLEIDKKLSKINASSGDLSTQNKWDSTQTGGRNADEVFCSISPTPKAVD